MPPPFDSGSGDGLIPGRYVVVVDPNGNPIWQGRTTLPDWQINAWLESLENTPNGARLVQAGLENRLTPPGTGGSHFDLTPTAETTDAKDDGSSFGTDVLAIEAAIWQAQQDAYHYNPSLPAWKFKKVDPRLKQQDPCAGSTQAIKNSQIPPANSDPNGQYWDPAAGPYWGSPLFPQAQGLQAERQLAALASDYGDYAGVDLNAAFQKAVGTIVPTDTPEEVADKMMKSLLDQAGYLPADGVYPTGAAAPVPGSLSPALISVLDQIAQEIQDGNGGNIDWSAFANYLNAQANADAAALQAAYIGGNGTGPCGDINGAVNTATNSQRSSQRNANNALKKLDKNIKPPPPPPPPPHKGLGNVGPVKMTNPFSGVTASTPNSKLTPLGPISPGLLHSGEEAYTKGLPISDKTRKILQPYGGLTLGQMGDLAAQSSGLLGGTLTPTDLTIDAVVADSTAASNIDSTFNAAVNAANLLVGNQGDQLEAIAQAALDAFVDMKNIYDKLMWIINNSGDKAAIDEAQAELNWVKSRLDNYSSTYTQDDSLHRKLPWP